MLGERICLLRRSVGLRRAELAERLQVSTSAVGMYESRDGASRRWTPWSH